MYLGARIPSATIDHWGIYIETEEDFETRNGLCVELDRTPEGGIWAHSRTRREREETEPQKGIKYHATGIFTSWEDDRIVRLAEDICKDHMFEKYQFLHGNCQTLVNLLVQKIANGQPYIPRKTASHLFGQGPSKKNLVDVWEADKAHAETLSLSVQTPAAQSITWGIQQPATPIEQTFLIGKSNLGDELDFSEVKVRNEPLTLEEQRWNAYYLSNRLGAESEQLPQQSALYGPSSVPYSDLDHQDKVAAFKASSEDHFNEVFRQARGFHTRAEGLAAYESPKINPARLEEKKSRLADLNTQYLRSKRKAIVAKTSQSGRLAEMKAVGQYHEPTSEEVQQCLESWAQNDEQEDNPEIVDHGQQFSDEPHAEHAWRLNPSQ